MASELTVGGLLLSDGSNDVELQMGNSSYGIEFDYSAGDFKFKTNGTTKMTLAHGGLATFSNGIAVTTGGIKFPATQSASADANTLDDYEEGYHTPTTITCSTSGTVSVDASYDTLAYTKVGRVVHVQGYVKVSAVSSPVGYFNISLPFTAAALDEWADYSVAAVNIYKNLTSGNANEFSGTLVGGETVLRVHMSDTNDITQDSAEELAANTRVQFQLTYIAA